MFHHQLSQGALARAHLELAERAKRASSLEQARSSTGSVEVFFLLECFFFFCNIFNLFV